MQLEKHRTMETTTVSVNEALDRYRRLVVLGDPGSGKTTLCVTWPCCMLGDLDENDHLVSTN